MTLSLREQK